MSERARLPLFLSTILALYITFCVGCGGGNSSVSNSGGGSGGGSGPTPPSTPGAANEWTWQSGSSTTNSAGVYGTLGTAAASNVPGARDSSTSWTDLSGNLWLFGGETQTIANFPALNDLWEFNPIAKTWAWISGSNSVPTGTAGQPGVYGTLGTASVRNVPGGRDGAAGWKDGSGNLWLFGGFGVDSTGAGGYLNDLWEFNPAAKTWTWVRGSNTANAAGIYGAQGIASTGNVPGARSFAVSWTDRSGNFWLFGGGSGTATAVELNDLWEFNPMAKTWTWVSGSSKANQKGIYGSLGTPSAGNVPGGRGDSASWIDSSGNLWLFGGAGLDSNGTEGILNDLWEFNPTTKTWTWVSGSSTGNAAGMYGSLGTGSVTNTPGARNGSVSWIDRSGNLWLFGGDGIDSTGTGGGIGTSLNDLWKFNPTAKTWTWAGGSNLENAVGVYGALGAASTSNVPGSRYSAVSWIDTSGNFWLFGGQTGSGDLNDLWEYQP